MINSTVNHLFVGFVWVAMTSHALKHQDLLITLAHGNFIGDATVCTSQHLKSVLKDPENIAYWWSHGKGYVSSRLGIYIFFRIDVLCGCLSQAVCIISAQTVFVCFQDWFELRVASIGSKICWWDQGLVFLALNRLGVKALLRLKQLQLFCGFKSLYLRALLLPRRNAPDTQSMIWSNFASISAFGLIFKTIHKSMAEHALSSAP